MKIGHIQNVCNFYDSFANFPQIFSMIKCLKEIDFKQDMAMWIYGWLSGLNSSSTHSSSIRRWGGNRFESHLNTMP